MRMAGAITVFNKEIADHFGSKRFIILFGLIVALASMTAYQGVIYLRSNTSAGFLSIFSGSQFGFSFVQIMVFFGPILGLIMGFDAINKERASGTLSVLLSQPIFRDSIINGKFLAGTIALTVLTVSTIGIMCGLTIPMLGFGPTLDEVLRIVVLTSLTILYLVFWLSLGILFSVLAKKTSTSILASMATWLMFTIVITILASVVASILVPTPAGGFITGALNSTSPQQGFQESSEFREAVQQRAAIQSNIQKISPTNLYSQTAFAVLGQTASAVLGMTQRFGQGFGQFERTLTLAEALGANWANLATLAVGLVVCFAVSYMRFLRSEIRPGG